MGLGLELGLGLGSRLGLGLRPERSLGLVEIGGGFLDRERDSGLSRVSGGGEKIGSMAEGRVEDRVGVRISKGVRRSSSGVRGKGRIGEDRRARVGKVDKENFSCTGESRGADSH